MVNLNKAMKNLHLIKTEHYKTSFYNDQGAMNWLIKDRPYILWTNPKYTEKFKNHVSRLNNNEHLDFLMDRNGKNFISSYLYDLFKDKLSEDAKFILKNYKIIIPFTLYHEILKPIILRKNKDNILLNHNNSAEWSLKSDNIKFIEFYILFEKDKSKNQKIKNLKI